MVPKRSPECRRHQRTFPSEACTNSYGCGPGALNSLRPSEPLHVQCHVKNQSQVEGLIWLAGRRRVRAATASCSLSTPCAPSAVQGNVQSTEHHQRPPPTPRPSQHLSLRPSTLDSLTLSTTFSLTRLSTSLYSLPPALSLFVDASFDNGMLPLFLCRSLCISC